LRGCDNRAGLFCMVRLTTIRELFVHNDWASTHLLSLARPLSDTQLDQPFEMGEGSLRRTLNHMWAAERVWLDRWQRAGKPNHRADPARTSIQQLAGEFAA